MTAISSREARRALEGATVSTRALAHDPRTAGLGLESADANHDGRIEDAEIGRLVAAMDRLDARGDGRIGRPGTRGVASRRALQAVATIAGADALAEAAREGLDLSQSVTFIGVTRSSLDEARALRERGVPVELIRDVTTSLGDHGWREGKAMPLGTRAQREGFIDTLALPDPVAGDVERVLANTPARGRGEIAALARQWAGAYHGEAIPERLVVSGHGDGATVFETQGDELGRADLLAMAHAMPAAAQQIRHVHIAACQHGYEPRTEPYFEAFSGLQSVWGYAGFAPSGATARTHQSRWEQATRSDEDAREVHATLARGTRRAVAVAVHRRGETWEGPPVEPLSTLGARAREGRDEFERTLRGELVVTDPGRGFAAEHYQTLQSLTAHHDFADQDAGYRETWELRREQCLRLRFFTTHVAPSFERAHHAVLDDAFALLGLERPNFATLDRAETIAAVRAFDAAFQERGEPRVAQRARELLDGLENLRPEVIPARWL